MELSYLRENRIFEIHLKNWSLESYLKKIGILEFIWSSDFQELNARMRIFRN